MDVGVCAMNSRGTDRPSSAVLPWRERLAGEDLPAMGVDPEHRVVFWNRGAERLFGLSAAAVLGRHCHELLEGRDVFGNRFCYPGCSPCVMLRSKEPVGSFELRVSADGASDLTLRVTTIVATPNGNGSGVVYLHTFEPTNVPARAATVEPPLTRRESEILQLVASGLQNKEVAQKLGLSLATVRNHVHNILDKLGLHSKLEAVALAFRAGWVEDPSVSASRQSRPAADTPSACIGSFGR
jgi:DNA-binding CsgD family transcriptional regulator